MGYGKLVDVNSCYVYKTALTAGDVDTFGVQRVTKKGALQGFEVRLRADAAVSGAITLNLQDSIASDGTYATHLSKTTAGALAAGDDVLLFSVDTDIKEYTKVTKDTSAVTGTSVTIYLHEVV